MTAAVIPAELSPQSAPNWLVMALVLALHVLAWWGITKAAERTVQDAEPSHSIRVRLIQTPPAPKPVAPQPKPQPDLKPEPKPEPKPQPKPEPEPEPKPEPEQEQVISQNEPDPEPEHTVPPAPEPEPKPKVPLSPPEPTPTPVPQSRAPNPPPEKRNKPDPIILPSIQAAYRNNPLPVYPRRSRRLGQEGRVLLRVHITPEGRVDQIAIKHSSGYELLDEAALEAVRDWRFSPAHRAGQPVAAWVLVPIYFKLN